MRGHATAEEEAYVTQLEARTDADKSPIEQVIDLAVVYIDPCHEQDKAMDLLSKVLQREPTNNRAKLWLATCYIWYLMEYAPPKAILKNILDSEPSNSERAAACRYLAYCLEQLHEADVDEEIRLLELSVALEPSWKNNRFSLAYAYRKADRSPEAVEQMKRAIANVIEPDASWELPRETYEIEITGRFSSTKFMKSSLVELERELSP